MKNIAKKQIDAMAELRKTKNFQSLSLAYDLQLRLALEIYQQRECKGWSQQDLAKEVKTTQKVISKLENGEVNAGLDIVRRLGAALDFSAGNWARIYGFSLPALKIIPILTAKNSGNEVRKNNIAATLNLNNNVLIEF